MNRYMLEEFHKDPVLLRRRLTGEAHRERARAIGDAIAGLFAGIARLFGAVKARLAPRNRQRASRWIARLG